MLYSDITTRFSSTLNSFISAAALHSVLSRTIFGNSVYDLPHKDHVIQICNPDWSVTAKHSYECRSTLSTDHFQFPLVDMRCLFA